MGGESASVAETGVSEQRSGTSSPSSSVGLAAELRGFRVFKGNEQWRVHWPGTAAEYDTWECASVVQAEGLGEQADDMRRQAR